MFSLPVLVGLGVAVLLAIATGVALTRRGSAESVPAAGTVPQQAEEPARAEVPKWDCSELARRLQIPLPQLEAHQPTYREVRIAKSKGGVRRLEIPDDATKELQRTILRRLLVALDAHPLACGFEEDTSIVDAALPHQKKGVVVKMDIRRFFESTTDVRIRNYFSGIGWDAAAADLLTRLTTNQGHLPQGAPTSPRLSNLVNAPLDQGLLKLARKHKGHYTRYADDVTMSFDIRRGRVIRGLTQVVRRILKSYGYSMHGGAKLKILRQNQRQLVLGLVVNSQVALPRKTRRWLRAIRHRIDSGKEATVTPEQLRGWEAYAAMIETQREE